MITYVYLYVLYLCIYTFNYRYTVHVQCDFQPIWDDDLEIMFMLGTLHQPNMTSIPTFGPSQAIPCDSHEPRPQVVLVKI